jgi:hypothetical protein
MTRVTTPNSKKKVSKNEPNSRNRALKKDSM